ncbi:MAG: hypothetical protein U0531_05580 [Dehalococcoidia bacterium]
MAESGSADAADAAPLPAIADLTSHGRALAAAYVAVGDAPGGSGGLRAEGATVGLRAACAGRRAFALAAAIRSQAGVAVRAHGGLRADVAVWLLTADALAAIGGP